MAMTSPTEFIAELTSLLTWEENLARSHFGILVTIQSREGSKHAVVVFVTTLGSSGSVRLSVSYAVVYTKG